MTQTQSVKMAGSGETRLRLRLNRLLDTADWRPSSMPPAAVLIVRHLADPLPGKLVAQATAVRAPVAWEAAVRQQMAALYDRAVRPYRGHLPPSAARAAAICFADEAEMLACLALDASRGLAADRWWWQALRRARPGLTIHESVRLLQEQPRLTPAILSCLSDWDAAATFMAVLSAAQAAAVLTAVIQTFHLPRLPTSPSDWLLATAPESNSAPAEPPWDAFLPPTAVPTTLPPPHTCLLGLSLTLTRRPAAASAPTFQRQLQTWWQAQNQSLTKLPPNSTPPPTPTAPPSRPVAASPPDSASATMAAAERPFPAEPSRSTQQPAHAKPDPAHTRPLPPTPPAPPKPQRAYPPETAVPANSPHSTASDGPGETAVFPFDGIPTQLGGILYLINVMVRLNIANPEEAGDLTSQFGAWGVLELLARDLLAPIPDPLQADPIWSALAKLDGRSPDKPLAARHSSLTPHIRTYLLDVLHLDDPGDLTETLFMANGRLHITNTHVDLIMPLDAVSLPVRLAGLDFDPGWQPAFGRVIQFYFQ